MRLNTINSIWYQNGISGIKLKMAYFTQRPLSSEEVKVQFLGQVSGLCPSTPHRGPGILSLPLQRQERAAKVPKAAGERLLGCNSTKRRAVSWPSLVPHQSALLNRRLSGLNHALQCCPISPGECRAPINMDVPRGSCSPALWLGGHPWLY